MQRPIGFRPWEISALVNREVIDQHSEEAAFLWTQRDQAVASPRYTLKHLAKLDGRVEAHVDGLRVAAEVGWETCLAVLGAGPGEVFAGAILAFGSGDASRIQLVLEAGSSDPLVARGLISALGWLAKGRATDAAMALVGDVQPEVRRTGIAACAIHRIDPGPPLGNAIMDPTPGSQRERPKLRRNSDKWICSVRYFRVFPISILTAVFGLLGRLHALERSAQMCFKPCARPLNHRADTRKRHRKWRFAA